MSAAACCLPRHAHLAVERPFADWCGHYGIAMAKVGPRVVATCIEGIAGKLVSASVKQHLAVIRMRFDWLIVGQVLPFSPVSPVRGPEHVAKEGMTPVRSADAERGLLVGVDLSTLGGLCDRRQPAYWFSSLRGSLRQRRFRLPTTTRRGGVPFSGCTRRAGAAAWCRRIIRRRNSWTRISRQGNWGRAGTGRRFGPARSVGRIGWRSGRPRQSCFRTAHGRPQALESGTSRHRVSRCDP